MPYICRTYSCTPVLLYSCTPVLLYSCTPVLLIVPEGGRTGVDTTTPGLCILTRNSPALHLAPHLRPTTCTTIPPSATNAHAPTTTHIICRYMCETGANNTVPGSLVANPEGTCGVSKLPGSCNGVGKWGIAPCEDLSFLPVLGIVLLGVAVTLLFLAILRCFGACNLAAHPVHAPVVKKVRRGRERKRKREREKKRKRERESMWMWLLTFNERL